MIKPGKKTKAWNRDRAKLKIEYEEKGITTCEARLDPCWVNNALSFAHRHKRSWYWSQPELLGDFNQTILACIPCHNLMEHDAKLTEELFVKLRPNTT